MNADELAHTIKHLAAQSSIEFRPWVYAHVSNYDPVRHAVRVIVPSMRDDQTDSPLYSGWMPLGTPMSGGESGVQVVPKGGASQDNPTDGELALVALNERGTGVASVICMFYSQAEQAPHNALAQNNGLQPGEILIRHESGTITRFHQNGDVEIVTGKDGAVSATTSGKGGITLNTTGSGPVTVETSGSGGIKISSTGSADISVSSSQNLTVNCLGNIMITSKNMNLDSSGNLKVTGNVTAGNATTLETHKHTVGNSTSSSPIPGT